MFIAALFTVAKLWKQPRCPTTEEWIKKMWHIYLYIHISLSISIYLSVCLCIYTMEFYSAIKKNEILLFAGKWTEVENIILSEVSQVQKAKGCLFSLICGI
jgi:hypothetical protein